MTDTIHEVIEAGIYGYFATLFLFLLYLGYKHLYDLLYVISLVVGCVVVMIALGFGIKLVIDE
jgi:hypothetical protein